MTAPASLFSAPAVQDPLAMRQAGAGPLSLALMDARTRTLAWLSVFEGLRWRGPFERLDPPAWLAGHAGWHQEFWIARHLRRSRGARASQADARLPSVDPQADLWFRPDASTREDRWMQPGPPAEAVRAYLQTTLDATLELLDKAEPDDDGLHMFRQALHHEDITGDLLAVLAQMLDLPAERHALARELGLYMDWPSPVIGHPLGLPGQRVAVGTAPGGWVPEAERWVHEVAVPAFEIDAQPVGWSAFAEFIEDGGYDSRCWWTDDGWDWVQAAVRRSPRYVAQLTGGVLVQRQGQLQRVPGAQAVMHVTAFEAEAWCQWAGRRLPSDAEWSLAVQSGSGRGLSWGHVQEWVAGSAKGYPGGPSPNGDGLRVLRGASLQASPRLRHPAARRYVQPDADELFCGFRSCAV